MTHITFTSLATSDHATEDDFRRDASAGDCIVFLRLHGHTDAVLTAGGIRVCDPDTDPGEVTLLGTPDDVLNWLGY